MDQPSKHKIQKQIINLHRSENAWKPLHKLDNSMTLTEKDKLRRNVQAVLNKLTFQKFRILLAHLKRLHISTEEDKQIVVNLIYENAICEPRFCLVYAKLCECLILSQKQCEHKTEKPDFHKILIRKCEEEFKEGCQKSRLENKDENGAISYEETCKAKWRRIGNIRFIGELNKLNLISNPVIHEYICLLLNHETEESLECFCWLLKITGRHLESPDDPTDALSLDAYFSQVESVVEKISTSTRMKFMLEDLLDLKMNNWLPRNVEIIPKTIDEIHQEAAMEGHKLRNIYLYSLKECDDKYTTDQYTCMCEECKTTINKGNNKSSSSKNTKSKK